MFARAFTLLELLIVLLIIGILIAIGLYRYQSVQEASYDTEAKSALRAAFINVEAIKTKTGKDVYSTGSHPIAINDLTNNLNEKSDGLTYIAWTDQEPVTAGLTPNFTGNNHKQILTSIQPGNTMVAFCNKSKSGKAFCLGTSESELSTFASFVATPLNTPFTSASHATNVEDAYCALATPSGVLPRGCGDSGSGDENTTGNNQHDEGSHGWFGGNNQNEDNEPAVSTIPLAYNVDNKLERVLEDGSAQATIATLPSGNRFDRIRWSPDRTKIASSVFSTSGNNRMSVVDATSGVRTDVSGFGHNVFFAPQWNNNSTEIVYCADPNSQGGYWNVYKATTSASSAVKLTNVSSHGNRACYPDFLPNQTEISFGFQASGEYDVYKRSASTGGAETAVSSLSGDEFYPMTTPDGSKMIFMLGNSFYQKNPNTVGGATLIATSPQMIYNWSISPDSSKIAFFNSNYKVSMIEISTGTLTDVTGNMTNAGSISWSPNSDKIALSCQTTGNPGICILDITQPLPLVPTLILDDANFEREVHWAGKTAN